jgi:hypothetical protein
MPYQSVLKKSPIWSFRFSPTMVANEEHKRKPPIQKQDLLYLKVRLLRRHVSISQFWSFCVGVVICGEFSGWQVP